MPSPRLLLALLLTTLACDTTSSNVCGADEDCFSGEVCDRAIKECIPDGALDMRPDLSSDLGAPDMRGDMTDDLDAPLDQEADLPLRCEYNTRECGGACAIYPRAVGMTPPTCTGGAWTAGTCRMGYTPAPGDVCIADAAVPGEVVPDLGPGPHVIDGILDGFGRIHLVVGGPTKTRYVVWDGGLERWKVRELPHAGRAVAIAVGYSGDAHLIIQDADRVRYFVMTADGGTNGRGDFATGLSPAAPADVAIAAHVGIDERVVGAWLDTSGKITLRRTTTNKNLLNPETSYQRAVQSTELELVLESDDKEIIFSVDKDSSGVSKIVAQRAGDAVETVLWEPIMDAAPPIRSLHAINKSALTIGALINNASFISDPNSTNANALPSAMAPITGGDVSFTTDIGSALQIADIAPPDQLAYLLDSGMSSEIKSAWRMSTWAVKTVRDGQIKGLRVFGDKNARWAAFTEGSGDANALHVFKLPPPSR